MPQHDCGPRDRVCPHCHAKLWRSETTRTSICCDGGKNCALAGDFPQPAPEPLRGWLTQYPCVSSAVTAFRNNIRRYNMALTMASSGIRLANPPSGVSMVAITGALHHIMGPMAPAEPGQEEFAQMYIIDNAESQVLRRIAALSHQQAGAVDGAAEDAEADGVGAAAAAARRPVAGPLDHHILLELQQMLLDQNHYVRSLVQVMDMPVALRHMYDIVIEPTGHVRSRRHNEPTGLGLQEVAGFMPGEQRMCKLLQCGVMLQLTPSHAWAFVLLDAPPECRVGGIVSIC